MSVLIAEDDADIRALVSTILSRAGYHSEVVDDGYAALAAARRKPPQLYVLDVAMPDMSGLELCRALKVNEHGEEIPVLLISAESSAADIAAGYAAGCDDYLAKPFSARELRERVAALLPAAHCV